MNQKKKLKEALDKNKDLENEIKRIKNEENKLKLENKKLKEDLYKLNKIISQMQKQKQNNNIDNNEIKKLKNEIIILNNKLNTKDNEINDLKNKIKNNAVKRQKVDMEDIMVINFISTDSTVYCGIKCLPTDIFAEVEEKLYQKYDDLRNTNNTFTANARPILRFKKISENNIKDGDIIQLFKIE